MNLDAMMEATRLTRAGRLHEAAALLRGTAAPTGPAADAGPPTIDMVPPAGGTSAWTAPAGATAATAGSGGPNFADLLGRLKAGRAAPSPASVPVPAGARFETRQHAGACGARAYRLYVPARPAEGPRPLVVMLHGCTQDPEDFAAGTRMNELAEEFGFLVCYPAQSQAANASRCWNWFNGSDQARDAGEPGIVAGICRDVMRGESVDPARVFAAGLSAGGAAAAVLGSVYPDLFAAVGVHSGLACGAARDMGGAFAAMKGGAATRPGPAGRSGGRPARAIVFHGDRDRTVAPVNGDQVAAQFAAGGPEGVTETGTAEGGAGWTRVRHHDATGRIASEHWTVHGAGHAWSGGSPAGTYTDPRGPDASRAMVRFFLEG